MTIEQDLTDLEALHRRGFSPEQLAHENRIAKAARVLQEVLAEYSRAVLKHPGRFHSAHEGFAVLKEEVDELWDDVKEDHGTDVTSGRSEAIQVAAMAVRYITDLCDRES